jgi:guanosine-3',5'-bis(diphosphate) 3'-pyrophosphohydrolase
MNMVERARVFATAAHAAVKQVRKYTFEPYIVHPTEVANIVASVPHTNEMLAAAWLHDTVEDTGVSIVDIQIEFGNEVAALVSWLTDVSKPEDGNRAVRKAIDREHTAMAPAAAQTVKLADLISNSGSIMAHDPAFAKIYLAEKRMLLEVLTRGDAVLMAQARRIVGVEE